MSFDLRQNLLLVRDAALTGKPLFYFYNAMGREMVLTGDVLREIIERQKEGTLCTNTYWGFASDPTLEVWSFDDNNDLMLHHHVGKSCKTFLPYEMLESAHEGFKPINGLFIEDSLRRIIKIHLKATCREEQKITWFADLPESEMRSMLLSLGVGPMRVSREDKEGLVKLHDRWLEDFDDKYKYTHSAIGLDDNEKIPADYRPDRIRDITKRMMANGKTQDMMDQTLNDLLRQCRIRGDIPHPGRNFNRHQLTCYYATHLIFAHDAKEKMSELIDNPQFVVNFIYGWYPDYTWITINEETFEYQQSLVRAALISLQRHVQNEVGVYKIDHGMVKFADNFEPKTNEKPEDDGDLDLDKLDRDGLLELVLQYKLASAKKATSLDISELRELCEDHFGYDEVEEDEPEQEREPRKFPAVSDDRNISYEAIRKVLMKAKVPRATYAGDLYSNNRATVSKVRKSIISALTNAVEEGMLNKLPQISLEAIAYALTKMKDGDRYPRDAEYLKELIKHALR